MARVKGGGTPRSTPSTRFPAATAFTRSRHETIDARPSRGDGARRRSASPAAASRSRRSRSRSHGGAPLDARTIVAATGNQNNDDDDDDDPAAQLLEEARSVSLGASQSDDGDSMDEDEDEDERSSEDEQSSESGAEEAQEQESEQEAEVEEAPEQESEQEAEAEAEHTHDPGPAAAAAAEEDGRPTEGEFEVEKICSFQLAEVEDAPAAASDNATPAAPAVLLEIKWRGYPRGANTLEPEAAVQASAGPLLYQFWASRGGRDRALALNPHTAVYVPLRILAPLPPPGAKRRRGGERRGRPRLQRYLVQWVGYDVDMATPETASKLRDIAPELLERFLSEKAGAASAGAAAS